MKEMTHSERIRAVLEGQPTDRIPFACWGPHMNLVDRDEGDFTKACIAYEDQHHFDVMKIMSSGIYNIADLGIKYRMPSNADENGYSLIYEGAFHNAAELLTARKRDPYEGVMGRELRVMRNLRRHYGDSLPILPSIPGPSRMLGFLSGPFEKSFIFEEYPTLKDFVLENEKEYTTVMDVLTEQTIDLMNAFVEMGADGFFYCPGGELYKDDLPFRSDGFNDEEYRKYIRVYDDRILNAMKDKTWFNVVHIHGYRYLRMDTLMDLPGIQAINWEDQSPYCPSLAEVRAKSDRVLMGGIDKDHDFAGASREKIKNILRMKVQEAVRQAGPKLIVAGGCECSRHAAYRFVVLEEVIQELANNK